jgi:signal transduction histidine kinase/CheY-like chemotaxis protein
MGVITPPRGETLAGLGDALLAAATSVDTVLTAAARATGEALGASTAVRLDGVPATLTARYAEHGNSEAATTTLVCPLAVGDARIGELELSRVAGFGEADTELARSMAALVSLAVAAARSAQLESQVDQLRRVDGLGQLAAGVAHDFNNLLTVIRGFAELLVVDAAPGSSQYEHASGILQAASTGGELIHQVLTFGRTDGAGTVVELSGLFDALTPLLRRTLGEHFRLDVRVPGDLWRVRAERGQLEQVVVSLAGNARDAMDRGGVLTIDATNTVVDAGQLGDVEAAGRFVRLAISDTGHGMDRETQRRAFEPFFTTKGTPTSAGLGLATVAGIVHSLGGYVYLYSEPGIGTTVKVFLPALDDEPAPPLAAVIHAPAPVGAAPTPDDVREPVRPGHILVVEDQPELAEVVRLFLQPAGYSVSIATDAAEAMTAAYAGQRPQLLLTDVVLPTMTGPELARALRGRFPDLRVLYMSGYAAGVLGPRGHVPDNADLLQKPFSRATLLGAVERALRR